MKDELINEITDFLEGIEYYNFTNVPGDISFEELRNKLINPPVLLAYWDQSRLIERLFRRSYMSLDAKNFNTILDKVSNAIKTTKDKFNDPFPPGGETEKVGTQLLSSLGNIVEVYQKQRKELATEPEPIQPPNNNKIVIQWNENKNVLTDIFRQLKQITNKEGKPVIGNSLDDLAIFLRDNFSCFSNTELSTIHTSLKNRKDDSTTPKKTDRRIIIEKDK